MAQGIFVLQCKGQGIAKKEMSFDELKKWIDEEINFWSTMSGLDSNIILNNTNYGNPQIVQTYRNTLTAIKAGLQNNNDVSALEDFLSKAGDLRAVLAHGGIGEQLRQLVDANDQVVAQRLALIMSTGIVAVRDEVRRELATVAAILKYNPFMLTTADTVSAKAAMNRSQVIEQQMNKAQGAFDTAIAGALKSFDDYSTAKTQELDDLHTQYETHLLLQGPSRHWQRIAESSWRYAAGAFGLFIFMLLIPAVAIACNWASISSYIDHVVEISKGGISLAAVIVFTVPVLAYGWLLKHVSRIFTQNLMINADAEHRRVLAVTFLGLARRKSVGMLEQDRALILNALFRPSPTSPQDDGPPSGLLELFKK